MKREGTSPPLPAPTRIYICVKAHINPSGEAKEDAGSSGAKREKHSLVGNAIETKEVT